MSPSYRVEALHTATTILIAPSCLFILESNHKKRGRQDLERERERERDLVTGIPLPFLKKCVW